MSVQPTAASAASVAAPAPQPRTVPTYLSEELRHLKNDFGVVMLLTIVVAAAWVMAGLIALLSAHLPLPTFGTLSFGALSMVLFFLVRTLIRNWLKQVCIRNAQKQLIEAINATPPLLAA